MLQPPIGRSIGERVKIQISKAVKSGTRITIASFMNRYVFVKRNPPGRTITIVLNLAIKSFVKKQLNCRTYAGRRETNMPA